MKARTLVMCVVAAGVVGVGAACGGKKSGTGTPTPTATASPISGTITAVSGSNAYLVDNATDSTGSSFTIALTANGQNVTDGGLWNCFGPITTTGPGNSYDFFFTTGANVTDFDINIPAAMWTTAGPISIGVAAAGATGHLTLGVDLVNITGGTVIVDSAPTAENSTASKCAFHMGTTLTFDNTTPLQ